MPVRRVIAGQLAWFAVEPRRFTAPTRRAWWCHRFTRVNPGLLVSLAVLLVSGEGKSAGTISSTSLVVVCFVAG